MQYNDILVRACANAGIAAMTGDGMFPEVVEAASVAIKNCNGYGIPTIKPWDVNTLRDKFALVEKSCCSVVAMDIDAAGLPFLQNMNPPAGAKSVAELAKIVKMAGKPFIVKGIMTVAGAVKAREAGAAGIIVSNHGGRVLDQCPATAEVLPEIAEAVPDMTILVDGGIRSGVDVFKAIALGADGVVIARPYVTAVYGGADEGVKLLTDKLGAELADTMKMCGAASLADINGSMVRY
jgi:NAD(P)H-dependent flavin oxidoreductase YrpB (nitropropane dioxygenase family)